MNKRLIFILINCCFFAIVQAETTPRAPSETVNNEIDTIDLLITTTEQSLENQKKLRASIAEYQALEKQYIDSQDDVELLYKVIKAAKRTLDSIKANHLTYNFDSKFIEELNVFAQVGSKKGIPKP